MTDELDDGRMSLIEHLIELRKRLIYSLSGLMVCWAICYYFKIGRASCRERVCT